MLEDTPVRCTICHDTYIYVGYQLSLDGLWVTLFLMCSSNPRLVIRVDVPAPPPAQ